LLSQRTKYGLRALIALADTPEGQVVQIHEIADRQNVPKKFLELIMLDLKRHGFVFSQRGRGGGYMLARPAGQISFGQVLRAMDGPIAPLPCASVTGYRKCMDCEEEATCAIRKVMREVRDAMSAILDRTTLADVVGGRVGRDVLATVA
jgi:Rrf2 family protein